MGFFKFFKGKKFVDENNNLDDYVDLVDVTPFDNEEKSTTPEEIFDNKQDFKIEIDFAEIPNITSDELEKCLYEDEYENDNLTEIVKNDEQKLEEAQENNNTINNNENQNDEKKEILKYDENSKDIEKSDEDAFIKSQKKGFFAKLVAGLDKTKKSILNGVDNVISSFTKIDEDLFEELEEVLIMADIGVETTMNIVDNLRKRVKKEKITEPNLIKDMLVNEIIDILNVDVDNSYEISKPTVMLIIGVNGVGKTTTIGKLSNIFKKDGNSVLLAAADTFRAAAIDQLKIWGQKSNIDVISHEENSDPAAVIFDAVNAAKNRNIDVLICDTAGRLHNKRNLMEELKKISKIIDREYPQASKEVYLVLDATTGQNAMQQAKLFKEVADISGIILTKLDGTAKGGIVIAIKSELNIPVRYIGVGEGIDDLQMFDAKDFAEALFGNN